MKPLLNIPDDIWLTIFKYIAVDDAGEEEAHSYSSYNDGKKYIISRQHDHLLYIGLTCKYMHQLFESMFLFNKSHGFQYSSSQLRYNCAFRFQNAMEVILNRNSTHEYHVNLMIECIQAMPFARWKHLIVYDKHNLETKLWISKYIYRHESTSYRRREEIVKQLVRYALSTSNSKPIISILHDILSYKTLRLSYFSNRQYYRSRDPWISAHECIENFVEHLIQYLRAKRITSQTVGQMLLWANRVQGIQNEFAELMNTDALRERVMFFIHSPTDKSYESLGNRNEFLHRASCAMFCLAILLRKPKKELERMISFLYYHECYNIFQESDILAYENECNLEDISNSLIYISRDVIRNLHSTESMGLIKGVSCYAMDSSNDHYIHQISNIIATAYKFQIEEPLEYLLRIGLKFKYKRTKLKIMRILSRNLEDVRVSRKRNQRISHLLWDLYQIIDDKELRKEKKILHLHPFLSPGIFYRTTKNVKSIGLTKKCSLTCLGIHVPPSSKHPFRATLKSMGKKYIDIEINIIRQIIETLEYYNCSVLCRNIGNISTIIKVLNYKDDSLLEYNKAYEIIEWVINSFPVCPRRFDKRIKFDNDPLEDFKLLFQIILKYINRLKGITNYKSAVKPFILSCYDLMKIIVGWGSYLRHDSTKYEQWNQTLMKDIPEYLGNIPQKGLILLVPKLCELGSLKLILPILDTLNFNKSAKTELGYKILLKLMLKQRHHLTIVTISKMYNDLFKYAIEYYTDMKLNKSLFKSFVLSIIGATPNIEFILENYGSSINCQFKDEMIKWIKEEKEKSDIDLEKLEKVQNQIKNLQKC